jgi:hypothetical protein
MMLDVPDQVLGPLQALLADPSLCLEDAVAADHRGQPPINPETVEQAMRELAKQIASKPPLPDPANLPSPMEGEKLRLQRQVAATQYSRAGYAMSEDDIITEAELKAAQHAMRGDGRIRFEDALAAVRERGRRR